MSSPGGAQGVAAAAPLTEDDRRAVRSVRLRPILRDTPRNAIAGCVGSALIAAFASLRAGSAYDPLLPWAWSLAYTVTGAWMVAVVRRYDRGPRTDEALLATAQRLALPTASAGCVWGSSSWLMLPASDDQVEAILAIGHALVLMAVTNMQANDRRTAITFLVPATVIFVGGLWRLGDAFHVILGVGFIVFTGALLTFAKAQEEAIDEVVHLRLRTARLLQERTEQQRETDALRQQAEQARTKAEQANRDKTTFLAAAGHDLRQPMHALVQYQGQMLRLNGDPALAAPIEGSGKALASMRGLLDSISDVSRLLTGSVHPVVTGVAVAPLLDRLDAQMLPQAHAKGLGYRTTVQGRFFVQCDEVLLERVLRNLIANAIRYTERGQVRVDARARAGVLAFRVADTGIGIRRDDRARIFEPFFQVSNETRDRRKGLGLGLAVVAQTSALLGASIGVRSRPARGSVFTLRLTVASEEPEPASDDATPETRPDRAAGAFVVLVDDDDQSLCATESSLRLLGCEVLAAASSAQAIAELAAQPLMPELVVCDYRLVGETGLEAVAAIVRAQQARFGAGPGIAALLVSGDPTPADVELLARHTGLTVLHKPLTLQALHGAVNERLAALASGSLDR